MDYLTVKEFAEFANVSRQAVYQKIRRADADFMKFVRKNDNIITISSDASIFFEPLNVDNQSVNVDCKPPVNVDCDSCDKLELLKNENTYLKNQNQSLIELQASQFKSLQEQIERLQKQIEEKDSLIAEQARRMFEQNRLPVVIESRSLWTRIKSKFMRR